MINELLTSRIEAVHNACDAMAANDVANLLQKVQFDGVRLKFPPFREVSQVWLQAISKMEDHLKGEIPRLLDAISTIDDTTLRNLDMSIQRIFRREAYAACLQRYVDSLIRSAESYGCRFRIQDHRFDLANASYQAALANQLNSTKANIAAEIQIYLLNRSSRMVFSQLMTDRISILKKSGERIEDIKAAVSSNSITTDANGVLIEPGDLVSRKMSNGAQESFVVIDPGFHEAFHSIPAGYQMKVRKLGLPEAEQAVQNITYNVNGMNARITQNSVDNSTNIVTINPEVSELIAALRTEISRLRLSEDKKSEAQQVADAIEHHVQTGKPSKAVIKALFEGLPHVASVATIAQALISLF